MFYFCVGSIPSNGHYPLYKVFFSFLSYGQQTWLVTFILICEYPIAIIGTLELHKAKTPTMASGALNGFEGVQAENVGRRSMCKGQSPIGTQTDLRIAQALDSKASPSSQAWIPWARSNVQ